MALGLSWFGPFGYSAEQADGLAGSYSLMHFCGGNGCLRGFVPGSQHLCYLLSAIPIEPSRVTLIFVLFKRL